MAHPASTGPCLVSLTDGREFPLAGQPLIIGRHSASDIHLPGPTVSRRHAEIRATTEGYTLTDLSINGVLLNGNRITEPRLLLPGDLIRVGEHDLRYERVSSPPEPPTLGVPAVASPTPPPTEAEPVLASLLVTSGALKGTTIAIRDMVVDLGRAHRNEIVFREDGVSTEHARLELRGGGWILVDRGSTNGSFINGERVRGERALPPGATINIGEVSAVFQPAAPEVLANARPRKKRRSTGKVELVAELPGQPAGKVRQWIRRYGIAEIVGTLTAFAGSYTVDALTHNSIAAAYGGSIGETLGFYGTIILRELVHDAHESGTRREPYGLRGSIRTARNIFLEFGVGELIDTGLLRPLCMGLGTRYLGRELGILAGKLASDVAFYVPVILAYEIGRARRGATPPPPLRS